MRKAPLALVMMMFCLAGVEWASGQTAKPQSHPAKQSSQPPSAPAKNSQLTQGETDNGSAKNNCPAKPPQNATEGDLKAPQNVVEYGGGG